MNEKVSGKISLYGVSKVHQHRDYITPEIFDIIHENYTDQGQVMLLLVSFLGDHFCLKVDGLQKMVDDMGHPKFIDNAPSFSATNVSQQYLAPVKEDSAVTFITDIDGATKTDYQSETEFLGNLFYIATEQLIQVIDRLELHPTDTLVQVLFFLPVMANGHLFAEKVVGPAQSWFDLNYGNIDIVSVIDVNLTKSSLVN